MNTAIVPNHTHRAKQLRHLQPAVQRPSILEAQGARILQLPPVPYHTTVGSTSIILFCIRAARTQEIHAPTPMRQHALSTLPRPPDRLAAAMLALLSFAFVGSARLRHPVDGCR